MPDFAMVPMGREKGGGPGKRIIRARFERAWKSRVYRGQYADGHRKRIATLERLRALIKKEPEMNQLAEQVERYEAGKISDGILYQGQKVTYLEAVQRLWLYQMARNKARFHIWALSGLITEGQYRRIVGVSNEV